MRGGVQRFLAYNSKKAAVVHTVLPVKAFGLEDLQGVLYVRYYMTICYRSSKLFIMY